MVLASTAIPLIARETKMRNSLCAALLVVGASFLAIDRADAAVFNLRASLQNGYYVSGTVAVDAATGVVSAENTTLFRNGVALSTFGGPGSQGPFTPGGGVAPSYLFGSSGSNGYLFVGAVPGTSLVGYGGGELCSLVSAVRCAFSDLFFGGSDIANAVQGALLPVADAIRTFSLTGTFENGYSVTGTVVIDVTAGFVLDQRATLFSNGIVVDEFYNPLSQAVFAPGGGVAPSYLFGSVGAGGVLLNLGVPGTSLVGLRRRRSLRVRQRADLRLQRHLRRPADVVQRGSARDSSDRGPSPNRRFSR